MSGPPPKDPEQRARVNVPARGEWQAIHPLAKPVLGKLPARGKGNGPWSARTRRAWEGWRSDWVTGCYGPAEIAQVTELAFLYEEAVRGLPSRWNEVRFRENQLGLTLKGKLDLRLRLVEATAETPSRSGSEKPPLRLVNNAVVS